MLYEEAISFCKAKHSSLVEIESPEQIDFITEKLKSISNKVEWQYWSNGGSSGQWKAWWGGATDKDHENKWKWTISKVTIQDFVWGDGEPNDNNGNGDGEDFFCFIITSEESDYYGNDCSGSMNYPLCQQKTYVSCFNCLILTLLKT